MARRQSDNLDCVIKLVWVYFGSNNLQAQYSIVTEATALKKCAHKHVVKLVGSGVGIHIVSRQKFKIQYLAMEYLQGGTLLNVINYSTLSEEFIKRTFRKLAKKSSFYAFKKCCT